MITIALSILLILFILLVITIFLTTASIYAESKKEKTKTSYLNLCMETYKVAYEPKISQKTREIIVNMLKCAYKDYLGTSCLYPLDEVLELNIITDKNDINILEQLHYDHNIEYIEF